MRICGLACLLSLTALGQAPPAAPGDVARYYLDGWYAGDCARMERALDPGMVKQRWLPRSGRLETLHRSTLIALCAGRGGRDASPASKRTTVRLLDSTANAAALVAESGDFLETLLVARRDGDWQAFQILWLLKRDVDLNLTLPPADAAQRYYEAWRAKNLARMETAIAPHFLWLNMVRKPGEPDSARTVDHPRMLDIVRIGKPSAGGGRIEILWQRGPLAVARIVNAKAGYLEYLQMARQANQWRVVHGMFSATR